MRAEIHAVDVKLDATPGAASEGAPCRYPELCIGHTLQTSGTLNATDLRVEVSNDGVTWVELDAIVAPGITHYEERAFKMLRIRTEAIGPPDPAQLTGAGGLFTGAPNTELTVRIDGVTFPVLFAATDDTLGEVVARLDAAAVAAGFPIGTVTTSGGQVRITGVVKGAEGEVAIVSGTAGALATIIGFTNGTTVNGVDNDTPAVTYGGMNVRMDEG